MLNTAVADELIQRNPCTVRGAGVSRTAEPTVATNSQVNALADAVPSRYRVLILLAAWSGARWSELVALTRDGLDLERGTITIDRQYVELRDGSLVLDTSKTAAGVRTVHIPPHLARGAPGAPGHVDHRGLVSDLPQRQGRADPSCLLAIGVAARAGPGRAAAVPRPRPAAHRQHTGGGDRCALR